MQLKNDKSKMSKETVLNAGKRGSDVYEKRKPQMVNADAFYTTS